MLKRMINYAAVDLTLVPLDPLLIKSGQATVGGVDMSFVRTYRYGANPEPFIPGSSLKGVIRSYAEKICRSLREDPVPVCLPYLEPGNEQAGEARQAACGLQIRDYLKQTKNDALPTPQVYALSCPACRLFGSHYFTSRLATTDGYLTDAFKATGQPLLETRDGVAIDRLTGGPAGGAKYDLEVLTKGEFGARLEIQNFERWQLGLLGLVLRDLTDGLVRIGMGKSRGLGRIQGTVTRFEIHTFGAPCTTLTGLAGVCRKEELEAYGFFAETDPGRPLPPGQVRGLKHIYDLTENWPEALEVAVQDLVAGIAAVPWPQALETFCAERRP